MSFLNQLKAQAQAAQSRQGQHGHDLEGNTARTEAACVTVQHYFRDLAKQLSVIEPAAPRMTLDGKTPWPAMKLVDFRSDARKKMLRGREAFDNLSLGWQVVPQVGAPVGGVVKVNFPPELERVQSRLSFGLVKHERKEIRHPEKNSLLAIEFHYLTQTRGNVLVTPDHDNGLFAFRLLNTSGFEIATISRPADQVNQELLDELAKRIVSQPHLFE